MRQRDILSEIAAIKSRSRYGSAFTELWNRLSAIDVAFEALPEGDTEGLRYFPVAIVGCIEGYTRLRVRDLVDFGEPYFTNGGEIAKSFRLEFAHLRAVHGGGVTVGELIAHNVQVSSLEQVLHLFERLVGSEFKPKLINAADKWGAFEGSESPILQDPDRTFGKVQKTFELRHIICHELASGAPVRHFEMVSCMEESLRFLRALDSCLSTLLDPNGPSTSLELHSFAVQSLERSQLELDAVVNVVRGKLRGKALQEFDAAHEKWRAYVDASVNEILGPREDGGSIWPMEHAFATKEYFDMRIHELRQRLRPET